LQQISQSIGFVAAIQFLVGDLGGLVALGSQVTKESLLSSYSRAAETEADLEGARMMHAAGLDPKALADFFSRSANKDRPLGNAMKWLDRHPSDAKRVESITQFTQTLPKVDYQKLELDLQSAKANLR
jgi:predicted Zn-dependent protease